MDSTEKKLLAVLWNYLKLDQPVEPPDVMIVCGSLDCSPAERAVELYHRGLAPRILMSGGFGKITRHLNRQPEAEIYAAIARRHGVPTTAITVETKSTNTDENRFQSAVD